MAEVKELVQAVPMSRDQLRSLFLGRKPKEKEVTLKTGITVKIRQPTVGVSLDLADKRSSKERMIGLVIQHTYVPGTDQRLFDEQDQAVIEQLPSSDEFTEILEHINSLSDVGKETKDAGKD